MSIDGEPLKDPLSSPNQPERTEPGREDGSKHGRRSWRRSAVIATLAPLVIAIVIAVVASVVERPRLDASSEASLEASLQKLTAGMSDAQKKEFLGDCMELTLPDTMKSAFQRAFLSNGPPATTGPRMYRPLQGMMPPRFTARPRKCEFASRDVRANPDEPSAERTLPGVPSPFGEGPDREKLDPK